MTQELIDKFKEKQGFESYQPIDDRVHAFDGFYFDVGDIEYDMERKITPGRIKLYALEGRDGGSTPSYPVWLASWEFL